MVLCVYLHLDRHEMSMKSLTLEQVLYALRTNSFVSWPSPGEPAPRGQHGAYAYDRKSRPWSQTSLNGCRYL